MLSLAEAAFGLATTEFVMMSLFPIVADDLHISIPTAGHLLSRRTRSVSSSARRGDGEGSRRKALPNAGGALVGELALAAGFGVTSPAVAGAGLAVLGLGGAAVAYAVDRRRAVPTTHVSRLVAAHVPHRREAARR